MKDTYFKKMFPVLVFIFFVGLINAQNTDNKYAAATKENSSELRHQKSVESRSIEAKTLQDQIKQRMDIAWGEWKPDYEGWVKWSNSLYAPDATINAIGANVQKFRDYQASMKHQRDAFTMEMGPIFHMIVENNVVALVYHMYLTPKNVENAPTYDMLVTEFNTLEEIGGVLMVTHLDLYTDGGGMFSH